MNLFEGRVHNGIASVGGEQIHAPKHGDVTDTAATAHVRPHDIDIAAGPAKVTVEEALNHAIKIGPRLPLASPRRRMTSAAAIHVQRKQTRDE